MLFDNEGVVLGGLLLPSNGRDWADRGYWSLN
ncbi:MAG: hypothetical protein ACI8WM_002173 [Burkholderiaceae bacterium]|jgi:hypothetical protein